MSKLITFFLFVFIGASILSAVMGGGGGIVSTRLAAAATSTDNVITVDSTDGFLKQDYIMIGSEKILFTNKTVVAPFQFTGCVRGYGGTDPDSHSIDAMVYSADASVVNSALGFSIAATADSMGLWATVTIPFYFMTRTLPRIVSMNFSFLQGDLAIIGWLFFAAGIGLIITLGITLAGGRRV